jgi:ABC-type uncharacterized transport system permease subunit
MRIGLLLAAAVVVEIVLIVFAATEAIALARIVLGVALVTQSAALATFLFERTRVRTPRLTPP